MFNRGKIFDAMTFGETVSNHFRNNKFLLVLLFTKSLKVIELYFILKRLNIGLVHYFIFVMNTLNTWQCLIHVDLPD